MYVQKLLLSRLSETTVRYMKVIVIWMFGFLLGCCSARSVEPPIYSLMRRAVQIPMSIDGLLTAYFLPFLTAAVAFQMKRESWLRAVCFIKAFTYAYLANCLFFSQTSAWLLIPFFCFSDLFSNILVMWFAVREHSFESKFVNAIPMVFTTAAACLDFFVFSPFLAMITA